MPVKDHYAILGVTREAHPDVVKAAYYALVKKFHPDKTGNDPKLLLRFREIGDAWEMLSREDRREAYDRSFVGEAPSAAAPSPSPNRRRARQVLASFFENLIYSVSVILLLSAGLWVVVIMLSSLFHINDRRASTSITAPYIQPPVQQNGLTEQTNDFLKDLSKKPRPEGRRLAQ